MSFNSLPFIVFFVVFFFLYWFIFHRNLKFQNLLILAGSYFFYCWWDWHFLFLLILNSSLNYALGYYMAKATNQRTKSILLYIGVLAGVGSLVYFKYTNFFITSFISAFEKIHIIINIHTINIALPLGISFYTFRTLSYLFDINKEKFKPTSDIVVFFSFVAFFPCLLAGPIDKAQTLIPQLLKKREFNYEKAVDAMRQILYGLFKKIVIADNLAQVTNNIFDNYHHLPGSTLALGVFYYSIEMYTDFSGYSDMAIGFARLIGFDITKNFNFPFFSQSIAEYWRKWHMSLTKWLTEYLFTPLSIALRDYGKMGLILAIIINLTVIGIWHGANWTFVLFGLLHGIYFIPLILKGTMNKNKKIDPDKLLPSFSEFVNMLKTFILVNFAFIFFRSDTVSQAFSIIRRICSISLIQFPQNSKPYFIPVIIVFLLVEWIQRNKQHVLQIENIKQGSLRWGIYFVLFVTILIFVSAGDQTNNGFIYVKF